MPAEMEMKFAVANHQAVRRALRSGGAQYLQTALLRDTYYDRPDGSLSKSDVGLRLREIRRLRSGSGGRDTRPELTFKGPRRRSSRAKVRREVQTRLDDPAAIAEILQHLGVRPTMIVEKRRASYRMGRCLVELDELPLIGCFVEVEGPSVRQITRICQKLKLPGQPIGETYVELLLRHCRRARIPSREITFAR